MKSKYTAVEVKGGMAFKDLETGDVISQTFNKCAVFPADFGEIGIVTLKEPYKGMKVGIYDKPYWAEKMSQIDVDTLPAACLYNIETGELFDHKFNSLGLFLARTEKDLPKLYGSALDMLEVSLIKYPMDFQKLPTSLFAKKNMKKVWGLLDRVKTGITHEYEQTEDATYVDYVKEFKKLAENKIETEKTNIENKKINKINDKIIERELNDLRKLRKKNMKNRSRDYDKN